MRVVCVVWVQGNADAGFDLQVASLQVERLAESAEHLVCRGQCRVTGWQILQQHHKLVTTQTRHRVGFAHALQQSLGYTLQQTVANGVAQAVVHFLESVQVDEQEGHHGLAAFGAHQRGLQAVHEQLAVG